MVGFRKSGFFFREKDLLENSLSIEEVFDNLTLQSFKTGKGKQVSETLSQLNGRCFTLSDTEGSNPTKFVFKLKNNLRVGLHSKGSEMFLTGQNRFPYEVTFQQVEVRNGNNFSISALLYEEIRSTRISKEENPCRDSSQEELELANELFINCSKKQIWANVSQDASCRIPDMNAVIPDKAAVPECSDLPAANRSYWIYNDYMKLFVERPWDFGCLPPCRSVTYKISLDYYHANNDLETDDVSDISPESFVLFSGYLSNMVVEEIESLEHDVGSLLVSAGGNLGLFLGFSVLSILYLVLKKVKGSLFKSIS